MLTGDTLQTLAGEAVTRTGVPWNFKTYYEKMAELVNAHFTGNATVQQEPHIHDIFEMLANMTAEKQAQVYRFLYNLDHRIYK